MRFAITYNFFLHRIYIYDMLVWININEKQIVYIKKWQVALYTVIYNLPLCYRQGLLDGEIVRTIFRAHNVPLPDDLLRAALSM